MDTPFPLGAIEHKDPASRAYPVRTVFPDRPGTVEWPLYGPVLDQGRWWNPDLGEEIGLGSCTGNGRAQLLNTRPHHVARSRYWTEDDAVRWYAEATREDPFPGEYDPRTNWEDTGSSMLTVLRIMKRDGAISEYRHVFTGAVGLAEALQWGPVMMATPWRERMFAPDDHGRIVVGGEIAGWHCWVCNRYNAQSRRFGGLNSWGGGWGLRGRFWFTWDGADSLLLGDHGEASLPVR